MCILWTILRWKEFAPRGGSSLLNGRKIHQEKIDIPCNLDNKGTFYFKIPQNID